jgi:hypothetical protein
MFIDFPQEEIEKYYETEVRMDGIETDIQTRDFRNKIPLLWPLHNKNILNSYYRRLCFRE